MQNSNPFRFYVGIDISKLTLDICLEDFHNHHKQFLQVDNTHEGFNRINDWLTDCGADPEQTILCGEHTGRYGEHLADWAAASQWKYAIVKTTALQKVSPEHHRKDDRYDARLLAEYARRYSDKLILHESCKKSVRQLNRFRKERRYMVDQRAGLRQKVKEADYHGVNMEAIKDCYRKQIDLLSKQIVWLEGEIEELIQSDSQLYKRYRQLLSAPGIGKVIGSMWLCLYGGADKLNPRKISSRFGFAPHPHRSGTSVKSKNRSAGFGNGEMRRLMHQAARSVATHNPHYRTYYQRKLSEGKHEKLILNNIINKIIRTICAMWNNDKVYDSKYVDKMKKLHQNT